MSELAFNLNGDAFEVPPNTVGWRVRKMKNKGAPEVAYGRNGLPLVLPLEADIDDLRAEVGSSGRYRLDPVDDTSKPIPNAPAGYVMVHDLSIGTSIPAPPACLAPLPSPSDNVVLEAMRMNAEITRTMLDRFPLMMEAAATLLRAADGAGLPARTPRATDMVGVNEDDDQEDGDDAIVGPAGFDLNALVAQLVPMLMASLLSGKARGPGLAAMFDWRKAVPTAEASPGESDEANASGELARKPSRMARPPAALEEAAAPPALGSTGMAHVIAVQAALMPHEVVFVQEVAKELSPAALRAWFDELSKLSVPVAVARIRDLIAGKATKGGAS